MLDINGIEVLQNEGYNQFYVASQLNSEKSSYDQANRLRRRSQYEVQIHHRIHEVDDLVLRYYDPDWSLLQQEWLGLVEKRQETSCSIGSYSARIGAIFNQHEADRRR